MRIDRLAERFHGAADRLAAGAAALPALDPGAIAFGADQPGRLGSVGQLLHAHWSTALGARTREIATHAARLDDTAADLRAAERQYRAADEESGRRLAGGSS